MIRNKKEESLPKWKNSPIKTQPSQLKKAVIDKNIGSNQRKAAVNIKANKIFYHKQDEPNSIFNIKEAYAMFDDDIDHEARTNGHDLPIQNSIAGYESSVLAASRIIF